MPGPEKHGCKITTSPHNPYLDEAVSTINILVSHDDFNIRELAVQ